MIPLRCPHAPASPLFMNLSIRPCRRALGLLRGDAKSLSPEHMSRTISFSRIVLILGLVCLHYQEFPNSQVSPFDGMDPVHHQLATFINSFMLFLFFSAVPLLSMISGWLFFAFARNPQESASLGLRRRIRRRVSSVYLPLVLWNGLFFVALTALFLLQPGHPLLAELNVYFGHDDWLGYVNAVFAVTERPVGYQFWFVRDLFVTVMISPLLWLLLRRAPYLGMALLGLAWMAGSGLLIFFRSDVVFFFFLGAFLRVRGISLQINRNVAWLLMAAYVVLVALRAAAPLAIDMSGGRPEVLTAATRSMRLIGVLACWGVFQHLVLTRWGSTLSTYGGVAFFLYAAHFPVIAQVKIWLWQGVPAATDGWMLAHYITTIAVTVTLVLTLAHVLMHWLSGVFAVMNGGRTWSRTAAARTSAALVN